MSSPRASRTAADLARLRGIIAAMERGGAPPAFPAPMRVASNPEPPADAGEWDTTFPARTGKGKAPSPLSSCALSEAPPPAFSVPERPEGGAEACQSPARSRGGSPEALPRGTDPIALAGKVASPLPPGALSEVPPPTFSVPEPPDGEAEANRSHARRDGGCSEIPPRGSTPVAMAGEVASPLPPSTVSEASPPTLAVPESTDGGAEAKRSRVPRDGGFPEIPSPGSAPVAVGEEGTRPGASVERPSFRAGAPAVPGNARGWAGGADAWGRPAAEPSRLPLGVREVDAALGGGLSCGALHELAGMPGEEGPLVAFAVGLAARAAAGLRRPVLLACQEVAEWEAGRLYGPGLAALGLPPEALLLVRVRKPQDVLFVMEEGLKCAGLSAVLGEFLSPVPEVLTATRRLALAAQGSPRLGLMLRHKADPSPCAALTRWRISTLPSPAADGFGGLGAPCFLARLTRNRFGPTGEWRLMFDTGVFQPAPGERSGHERGRVAAALSEPRLASPAHGSRGTEDVA